MRLTNSKKAAELKAYADSLRALGFELPILDRRYIKLAEYEDAEELIKPTTDADVKKALEKQFPKKPYDMIDWYECPECREIIAVVGEKPNYCPECGQKIDWKGIEKEDRE